MLFDLVCEHLNLLEKDYFGLTFCDADSQKVPGLGSRAGRGGLLWGRLLPYGPYSPGGIPWVPSDLHEALSVLCVHSIPQSFLEDLNVIPDGYLENQPWLPGDTEALPPLLGGSSFHQFPPSTSRTTAVLPVHCAASGQCHPRALSPKHCGECRPHSLTSQEKGPESSTREGCSRQGLSAEGPISRCCSLLGLSGSSSLSFL